MSTNIDKRVVEMKFDNQQFEKGVEQSVKSLEKLKDSLKLDDAAKSLESVERASKSFDMSGVAKAADTISNRFSAFGVISMTALQRVTNAAIDCGKKIANALSFEITSSKAGFSEYETQINAVQTILANTSEAMDKAGYSDQKRLDIVNEKLDELNTYADKTIYNFTEMTRNIGTFTAAGIDLDTSVNAIQGIANLAAVSGSTSQQASTAMYQLSQALASGTVKLQDWNSVVNAGMGGEMFQKALMKTAEHIGIVDKDAKETFASLQAGEVSFRESLKDGWLTSDVLTETLKHFSYDFEAIAKAEGITLEKAKQNVIAELTSQGYTTEEAEDIVKMADMATKAATEVKTLTQLFDTLNEAMQSGWTQSWEYILGDFNEAKELFTGFSDYFGNIIAASAESRNALLSEWKNLGGRDELIEGIWNIIHAVENVANSFKVSFEKIFPPATAEQLFDISKKFNDFTKKIKDFTENSENLLSFETIVSALVSVFSMLKDGIAWVWDGFKKLLGLGGESLGKIFLDIGAAIGNAVLKIQDFFANSTVMQRIFHSLSEAAKPLGDVLSTAFGKIRDALSKLVAKAKGSKALTSFGESIAAFAEKLPDAMRKIKDWIDGISNFIQNSEGLKKAHDNVINTIGPIGEKLSEFWDKLKDNPLFSPKSEPTVEKAGFGEKIASIWDGFKTSVDGIGSSISGWFSSVAGKIKAAWTSIQGFFSNLFGVTLPKFFGETLPGFLEGVKEKTQEFVDWLINALEPIADLYLKIKGASALGAVGKLPKALKSIGENVGKIGTSLTNISDGFKTIAKDGIKINNIEKKKDSIGNTILKIAAAIGILVGSVYVLSQMNTDQIIKGLAVIGILGVELFAVSLLFKGVQANAKAFLSMAAAVLILMIPIKILSGMDWEDAKHGIILLGVILAELAGFMRLAGSGFTGKSPFLSLAISLTILMIPINLLANMRLDKAIQGVAMLGVILLELAAFMRLAGSGFTGKTPLLSLAVSLTILMIPIKLLANMRPEKALVGIAALGAILLELAVFMRLAGKGFSGKTPFLSLAVSIAVLVVAVKALGELNFGAIVQGIVGLGALLLELGIFMRATNGTKVSGLLAMAVAMNVMVRAVKKMGQMKLSTLAKGVAGMGALMLAMSALLKSSKDVKIGSVLTSLLMLAGVMAAFIIAFKYVEDADSDQMLDFAISISLTMAALAVAMKLIGSLKPGAALAGVGSFAILIVGIGGIIAALGWLHEQWSGMDSLLESGANVLGQIGFALGNFVKEIIRGFTGIDLSGLGDLSFNFSLPDLGTQLSEFMANSQGFIDGAKNIDDSVMSGVGSLAGAIVAIAGSEFVSALMSLFTGENPVVKFSADMVTLGEALMNYSASIKGFTTEGSSEEDRAASIETAKNLAELNSSLPATGGSLQTWLGEVSMGKFSTDIVKLALGLRLYATTISGFSSVASKDDLTLAADTAQGLADLNDSLPATGGKLQDWLGQVDMEKFSTDIVTLAEGLKTYAENISGFSSLASDEDLTGAATIATGLATLNSNLPRSGGALQDWIGENSMENFSTDIVTLAGGLKAYAENISGFSSLASDDDFTKAVTIATGLAGLNNSLPRSGGALQDWIGEKNFTNFSTGIADLAGGLNTYATKIDGFTGLANESDLNSAITIAQGLADLNKSLPDTGSTLGKWLMGDKDLGEFSTNIVLLGNGLSSFAQSVTGVNYEQSETGIGVLNLLRDFVNSFEESGGVFENITKFFTGDKFTTLMSFVESMQGIGDGLQGFSVGVNSVKLSDVDFAKTVFDRFAGLVDETKETAKKASGNQRNLSDVANAMGSFGDSFGNFSEGIINADLLEEKFEAAKRLVNSYKAFNEVSKTNSGFTAAKEITQIGEKLRSFGTDIMTFGQNMGDVDTTKIDSAANLINTLIGVAGSAKTINPEDVDKVASLLDRFTQITLDGFNAGEDAAGIVSIGETLGNMLGEGIASADGEVSAKGQYLATSGSEGAKGTFFVWAETGRQLGRGLAWGISLMAGTVRDAAQNAAAGAIHAIEITWSVHSPSKVAEGLGRYWDLGLAGGIDRYADMVAVSSERAGAGAIESAKYMLADLTNVLALGVDATPTIRPVLDLTNVQNGVGAINGMFGATQTMGMSMFAGNNIRRNAGELNFDGARIVGGLSNKDVVTEIQNLNGRMSDLAEAVGNMQLVLDTGTLVGATSTKMDNQLGTLAVRKGRGN